MPAYIPQMRAAFPPAMRDRSSSVHWPVISSTTLREYAYALPGTDLAVADAIDQHLDQPAADQPSGVEADRS